jgi:hypothetical protein
MVEGTLVPLFQRPAFFGNTWFDCKSNYSLNVQVCSFFPCTVTQLTFNFSLFRCLISRSLTTELVCLAANTMRLLGKQPGSHSSILFYSSPTSGCGQTQRILCRSGARPHIKRTIVFAVSDSMLTHLLAQRKTKKATTPITISFRLCEYGPNTVLAL